MLVQNNSDTYINQSDKIKSLPRELQEYIGKDNLEKIKELHPLMQEKTIELYEKCKESDLYFVIVSGRRSYEEQKKLYDEMAHIYGEEKVGIPGKSEHEAGRAIDIKIDNNLSNSEKYTKIGRIWQSTGGYWGGDDIDEYWHLGISKAVIK